MGEWNKKTYHNVVGYGIGQYYEMTSKELSKFITLDYLCDRKWENEHPEVYDGIRILRLEEVKQLESVLIIIFAASGWIVESIKRDLGGVPADFVHVDEVIGKRRMLDGRFLKETYPDGIYEDDRGNRICFDSTLSDQVRVLLNGNGNHLKIGRNVVMGHCEIRLGNHGVCSIGDETEIIEAKIHAANAEIKIGRECLFASQVIVKSHDGHHIFSKSTGLRLNPPKDVEIGDQVWLAFRSTLLGGAKIGHGSIVGAGTITSSQFGSHKVIAGIPGRVVKEDVCWSRDDTAYFDHHHFDNCISKAAWKYWDD